jgi:2-hydroxychromene-2-carboxylate isomerase
MDVEPVAFYYDVGSPWCWIAAEHLSEVGSGAPLLEPVLASALPADLAADRGEVEREAARRGLPALRWPEPWPFDSTVAMLAATFARETGRAAAFSLAAMRQAFAGGRDLSEVDNVLIAAAACELHPRAVLKALESRATGKALAAATDGARVAGVLELPALRVGERLFSGPGALADAAAAQSP